MSGYCEVDVKLDPDSYEEFPNGVCVQEIELVFMDDLSLPSWRAAKDAVCAIDARRARELAFQLLSAAELAERWEAMR